METFLGLIQAQAIKYAVNSGIVLTSGYALKRFSRLLNTVEDTNMYAHLDNLQNILDGKIKVAILTTFTSTRQLILYVAGDSTYY